MSESPEQKSKEEGKAAPVWDMSQERAFTENLLGQRFNFFLVFFGFVVAGSVNARSQAHLQIILGVGSVICVLFAAVLARSQEKLDLILHDLFADTSHPVGIINSRAKPHGGRRRLIGVWIPRLCCAVLVVGFVLSLCRILAVPPARP